MERPRTAERHHRITARVAALLDRHNAYGMFHVVGCNQMDAPCRVFRRERQRPRYFLIDHSFRTIKIERPGTQNHHFTLDSFKERYKHEFGQDMV